MRVLNTSYDTQHIKIIKADGSRDTITLMPRGGRAVQLPEGAEIDPTMIGTYKKFLKTEPPLVAPAPAPAPAPTGE
jgi:hypothetical protein